MNHLMNWSLDNMGQRVSGKAKWRNPPGLSGGSRWCFAPFICKFLTWLSITLAYKISSCACAVLFSEAGSSSQVKFIYVCVLLLLLLLLLVYVVAAVVVVIVVGVTVVWLSWCWQCRCWCCGCCCVGCGVCHRDCYGCGVPHVVCVCVCKVCGW